MWILLVIFTKSFRKVRTKVSKEIIKPKQFKQNQSVIHLKRKNMKLQYSISKTKRCLHDMFCFASNMTYHHTHIPLFCHAVVRLLAIIEGLLGQALDLSLLITVRDVLAIIVANNSFSLHNGWHRVRFKPF